MDAWLDAVAGLCLVAAAVPAWRRSRRQAVLTAACALGWFAGDLSDRALLLHRPLLLHVVLAYPTGRLRGGASRVLLALAWVAALTAPGPASSLLTVALGLLVGTSAALGARSLARSPSGPTWRGRVEAVTAARAAMLFAACLVVPVLVRLRWPLPPVDGWLVAGYDVMVAACGLVLLAGVRRSPLAEADAVIELSEGPPELLDALRREASDRPDDPLRAALALLESNAALQRRLADQVEEVRRSRARLVDTTVVERRRLEAALADGAFVHLAGLDRALLELASHPDTGDRAAACREEVARVRDDLDQLARGLHPRVLTDRGLAAALHDLAARSPLPVTVRVPAQRLPEPVETALWYACAEALANLGKHARAHAATVHVTSDRGEVEAVVEDDGVGGAELTPGGGLAGLADRLGAVGGRLEVWSPRGRGTRLRIAVPLP